MAKLNWKPSNMLNPVPAVLVSCCDADGNTNIMTAAWAGTICSDPVMVSVSIRPERFSHHMIVETGEFVLNLTTQELVYAADFAGVKSGRDIDKFEKLGLTREPSAHVRPPCIKESPVNLECKVVQVQHLGSHDLFIAEVVGTDVDERLIDEKGRLQLERAGLIAYVHGAYYTLGRLLGTFGYSVKKTRNRKKKGR